MPGGLLIGGRVESCRDYRVASAPLASSESAAARSPSELTASASSSRSWPSARGRRCAARISSSPSRASAGASQAAPTRKKRPRPASIPSPEREQRPLRGFDLRRRRRRLLERAHLLDQLGGVRLAEARAQLRQPRARGAHEGERHPTAPEREQHALDLAGRAAREHAGAGVVHRDQVSVRGAPQVRRRVVARRRRWRHVPGAIDAIEPRRLRPAQRLRLPPLRRRAAERRGVARQLVSGRHRLLGAELRRVAAERARGRQGKRALARRERHRPLRPRTRAHTAPRSFQRCTLPSGARGSASTNETCRGYL